MKKNGFTIVEVTILFIIFLIVAFLVAPLSLDDTRQAKNTSKWRSVQNDFTNIFYSVNTDRDENKTEFNKVFLKVLENDIKNDIESYRITFMNGTFPNDTYRFKDFKNTHSNATLAIKLFDNPQEKYGVLLYDVNGKSGPNVWGKDVFGMDIYEDRFEPFCKEESISKQKEDCSKNGTGLCCSSYYLIGGNFD
jgi:type II secretory pathway pseudopilin PulG